MLKNERLLLVVDKPLTRSLPELHEDNDDFVINGRNNSGKYKLRRSTKKQTKNEILMNTFNMKWVYYAYWYLMLKSSYNYIDVHNKEHILYD